MLVLIERVEANKEKMTMFRYTNKKGFTLIELVIAMAVSSAVMAVIYSTYRAQLRSNVTQQALIEMQQNARAAMYAMERDIRLAGYDPTGATGATILVANSAEIHFQLDRNGDGDFVTGLPAPDNNDPNEDVRYALTGTGDLGREIWGTGLETVAENIEVLDFVYFKRETDGSLTRLATPVAFAELNDIYSIQITIIARSGDNVPVLMMKHTDRRTYTNQQGDQLLPPPNDNFRRILLTADLYRRNQGL
jgi:type IV pilus assembly protein PilW